MICELKKIRKQKNITQQELAKELNLGQSTIAEWENEKHFPNVEIAHKVAEYLGVRISNIWY